MTVELSELQLFNSRIETEYRLLLKESAKRRIQQRILRRRLKRALKNVAYLEKHLKNTDTSKMNSKSANDELGSHHLNKNEPSMNANVQSIVSNELDGHVTSEIDNWKNDRQNSKNDIHQIDVETRTSDSENSIEIKDEDIEELW